MIKLKCKTKAIELIYNSSAVAEMGDRLTTIDMGRNFLRGLCPLLGGGWIPIIRINFLLLKGIICTNYFERTVKRELWSICK